MYYLPWKVIVNQLFLLKNLSGNVESLLWREECASLNQLNFSREEQAGIYQENKENKQQFEKREKRKCDPPGEIILCISQPLLDVEVDGGGEGDY